MCESIHEKHKHITLSVICLCFVSASIIIDRTCQRYLNNLHRSFRTDLRERLDKGLIGFGVFVEPADITKYEFLRLPATDRWGVVMRKGSPLSKKKSVICPEDLWELPLIISRQTTYDKTVQKWHKLVWKKYQVFSKAAGLFLHKMQEKYK